MTVARKIAAAAALPMLLWTSGVVLTPQAMHIHIVNHCNGTMRLFDGGNVTKIKENAKLSIELKPLDIRAYRYDAISQATLAEFSIDASNKTWYDVSVIPTGPLGGPGLCKSLGECKKVTGGVGFNQPLQINPKVAYADENCRKLVCLEDGCDDAYQFPQQDEKTHSCDAGVDFQVVFCPTTHDTEQDWLDTEEKLESGSVVVVGDGTTAAPTQAPAVTSDSEVSTKTAAKDDSSSAVYVASALGGTVLVVVAATVVLRYRQRVVANVQYHWPDRKSSDAMSFVSAKDMI